jgi:ribonuclease HI
MAEESIERDGTNEADVRVYADGSGIDGMAGVARVLYRGAGTPRTLRYCLGPLSVGIPLAMHLLGNERNVRTATISLDNQAVITSVDTHKPKSGQYIIDQFLQQAEKKWMRANKEIYKLEITWVKGHTDIDGNEKVDIEAKKSARGKSSKACNLPKFLTENPLPLSISAARQEHKRQLKEEWKGNWKQSPRYPKASQIDPSMPSNKYRELTRGLRQAQASIIIQFRMGHIALNQYLHRITKSETPWCPSCQHDEETIHHYLFDCPTWRHERWHMSKKLGRKSKSLSHILTSESSIAELLKYVGRTEKFKNTFGEVNPNA